MQPASKPKLAPKGSGGDRKVAAMRIQAAYRGFRVRRHVASFRNSAQAYSSKLGSSGTRKQPLRGQPPPQQQRLPGQADNMNDTKSERIRRWADNAAQHPFDSPERGGGGQVDSTPVKHYNNGTERHETREERRERRRQRALNKPPPPPDGLNVVNDDTMSVSSIGSQSQDPRTWISSRSSRRQRRGTRKSKSTSGNRVPPIPDQTATGPLQHHVHNQMAMQQQQQMQQMQQHQQQQMQQALQFGASGQMQLNPYGGGTPGGTFAMPYNPYMPPPQGLGDTGAGSQFGSPPRSLGGGAAEFTSSPNYGAAAQGPVSDIMRDLNELSTMRQEAVQAAAAAAAAAQAAAQGRPTSAGGLPGPMWTGGAMQQPMRQSLPMQQQQQQQPMGPGFGGHRMSYPPMGGGGAWPTGAAGSGFGMSQGGMSAMSPIGEHAHMGAGFGMPAQQLPRRGSPEPGDSASVASAHSSMAEERLNRIEAMLEKLAQTAPPGK